MEEEMGLHYVAPCLWLDFGICHPVPKRVRVVPFQLIGTYLCGALHLICMLLIQYGKGTESRTPTDMLLSPAQIFSPFILLTSPPLGRIGKSPSKKTLFKLEDMPTLLLLLFLLTGS